MAALVFYLLMYWSVSHSSIITYRNVFLLCNRLTHAIAMDIIYTSITIGGFSLRAENPSSTGNILCKIYLSYNLYFSYIDLKSQEFEIKVLWNCRLDIGEGKEVNLEKCPRSKLQQQCIKYLGPVRFPQFIQTSLHRQICSRFFDFNFY